MSGAEAGFRGYIGCRPIGGHRVPQHVQNLVIRDYAQRHGLRFLLSGAEYVMPGSYLMLEQILGELEPGGGLIAYSLFMLPSQADKRHQVWRRVLDAGATLHAAVEEQVLGGEEDIDRLEMLFQVHAALEHAWQP